MMFRLYSLLIGYAFGSLQFAWFIGKIRKIDIREHGSGNAGMTNVTRVVGAKSGILVFVLDMAKAALAFGIANALFAGIPGGFFGGFFGGYWNAACLPGLYAGFGAAVGHNFPFYLGFRGGKGVSCTLGMVIAASWQSLAIIAAVIVPLILWKRYISLAALIGSAMLAPLLLLFGMGWEAFAVALAMAALIWWRHRGNIGRLLKGTERKLWGGKK